MCAFVQGLLAINEQMILLRSTMPLTYHNSQQPAWSLRWPQQPKSYSSYGDPLFSMPFLENHLHWPPTNCRNCSENRAQNHQQQGSRQECHGSTTLTTCKQALNNNQKRKPNRVQKRSTSCCTLMFRNTAAQRRNSKIDIMPPGTSTSRCSQRLPATTTTRHCT